VEAIFVARDAREAQLVKGLLEERGIPAAVRCDDPWGARDDVGAAGASPVVVVLDEHLESTARDVVATYRAAESLRVGGAWTCHDAHRNLNLSSALAGAAVPSVQRPLDDQCASLTQFRLTRR
jgi:hypothetical protein